MDIDEIVETFEMLDTGEERYRYIIELGKELGGLPEPLKTEDNRVHGCQSRVWMVAGLGEGSPRPLVVHADSDAFIVRGLIAILLAIFEGKTPSEVLATDPKAVFESIGLEQQISMGRRNGLSSMVKRVHALASSLVGETGEA